MYPDLYDLLFVRHMKQSTTKEQRISLTALDERVPQQNEAKASKGGTDRRRFEKWLYMNRTVPKAIQKGRLLDAYGQTPGSCQPGRDYCPGPADVWARWTAITDAMSPPPGRPPRRCVRRGCG